MASPRLIFACLKQMGDAAHFVFSRIKAAGFTVANKPSEAGREFVNIFVVSWSTFEEEAERAVRERQLTDWD